MKIQFDGNLEYQKSAVASVVKLLSGQEVFRTYSGATEGGIGNIPLGITFSDLGTGNNLKLENEEIERNLREVQLQNGLQISKNMETRDFDIEMESGTGRTYVCLRTIFELHKVYGFMKFIVIVPSIAKKVKIIKTLEMIEEHFKRLYLEARCYEYYPFDSQKLHCVRRFADTGTIQIMIVTVDAINHQSTKNLFDYHEHTGGVHPIKLIRATNPILIVHEPQRVEEGLNDIGRKAIEMMNPLLTLRYSSTHIHKHNLVYRLNFLDAYENLLIKRIEVAPVG